MTNYVPIATSRTQHLLAAHAPVAHALTAGFRRALLVGSVFIAAAVIALRATNTRDQEAQLTRDALPEPARA